jgi:hypothetical protein
MLTIGCVLLKRIRGEPLPDHRWSLGRYGMLLNIGSLCYLAPIFVFSFFPSFQPVTPQNMNWGSAMYAGMITFASIYYFLFGRHYYVPPVSLVHRDR